MIQKSKCMGGADCTPACWFWDDSTHTCKFSNFLDIYVSFSPILADKTKIREIIKFNS